MDAQLLFSIFVLISYGMDNWFLSTTAPEKANKTRGKKLENEL